VSVNRRHGAVKIVGANAFNHCLGLPRSKSTILLFDKLTMLPLAILDGTDISAVRTGAYASIVADLFYAPRGPGQVVVGAGRIAEAVIRCLDATHSAALAELRCWAAIRDERKCCASGCGGRSPWSWRRGATGVR
jgi:alanine dehydrogenase